MEERSISEMKERYLSKPAEVDIFPLKTGTDVILRKNIEEISVKNEEGAGAYKAWECDEVQFRYPRTITAEEISTDFEYWFENGPKVSKGEDVDLSFEQMRNEKYAEVSAACESTIYAGVDVTLSTGLEHFSLTEKDQINLFGKQAQMVAGEEKLEYHQDGQPCKYYNAEDMKKIIDAAFFYVSYNTTYCNTLNMWIKAATKPSDLEAIYWGATIPEEHRNEVLLDYMEIMAGGMPAENKETTESGTNSGEGTTA